MNNTLIFIRHAETKKDWNTIITDWDLTDSGKQEAEKLADNRELQDADIIISSIENKAFLTIRPLAQKLGKEIIQVNDLRELERGGGEGIPTEKYKQMKKALFEDFDHNDFGWETPNHALSRFKKAVSDIDKKYNNNKIIIATHGTVLALYFASLLGKLDDIMSRWKSLGFCQIGIVKNGEVVKDIV